MDVRDSGRPPYAGEEGGDEDGVKGIVEYSAKLVEESVITCNLTL